MAVKVEELDETVRMEDDQVILAFENEQLEETAKKLKILEKTGTSLQFEIEETQILKQDIGAFTKLDKNLQDNSDIQKLMKVEKVDILRDSLDEVDFAT